MDSTKPFLPIDEFLQLREQLLTLFQQALSYLRSIDPQIEIKQVRCDSPGFRDSGEVTIPLNPEDKGVLLHEVGHTLLARSVFHSRHLPSNKAKNEPWGEAFTEAI